MIRVATASLPPPIPLPNAHSRNPLIRWLQAARDAAPLGSRNQPHLHGSPVLNTVHPGLNGTFAAMNAAAANISRLYEDYGGPLDPFEIVDFDSEESTHEYPQVREYARDLQTYANQILSASSRLLDLPRPTRITEPEVPPNARQFRYSLEELESAFHHLHSTGEILRTTRTTISFLIEPRTFSENGHSIALGPWEVVLNLAAIDSSLQPTHCLKVLRGPGWLAPEITLNLIHPHIATGGNICLGAALDVLREVIYFNPHPVLLLDALRAWMHTHNPRGPYNHIVDYTRARLSLPSQNGITPLSPSSLIPLDPEGAPTDVIPLTPPASSLPPATTAPQPVPAEESAPVRTRPIIRQVSGEQPLDDPELSSAPTAPRRRPVIRVSPETPPDNPPSSNLDFVVLDLDRSRDPDNERLFQVLLSQLPTTNTTSGPAF